MATKKAPNGNVDLGPMKTRDGMNVQEDRTYYRVSERTARKTGSRNRYGVSCVRYLELEQLTPVKVFQAQKDRYAVFTNQWNERVTWREPTSGESHCNQSPLYGKLEGARKAYLKEAKATTKDAEREVKRMEAETAEAAKKFHECEALEQYLKEMTEANFEPRKTIKVAVLEED